MKRLSALILCITILILPLSAFADETSEQTYTDAPALTSDNAVAIVNVDNRQLVFSNRETEAFAPTASTKLTAMMVVWDLLAKHDVPVSTEITIAQPALKNIGSQGDISTPRLGLSPDSVYTIEDMISASLVANANDACSALCYYCATELMGGTMQDFIALMNAKAQECGATNTVYRNCTGLADDAAYTNVIDTAMITAQFFTYTDMVNLTNKPYFRLAGKSTVHNKNYLMSSQLIVGYQMKQAIGLIAGQNTANGDYCLITAAKSSDDLTYVFVVMGASGEIRKSDGTREFEADNAYDDMKVLIPWATTSFSMRSLTAKDAIVTEVKVNLGKNYDYVQLVTSESLEMLINRAVPDELITKTVIFDEAVYDGDYNGTTAKMVDAPIEKNQQLGRLVFLYEGIVLGEVPLVTTGSIEASGLVNFIGTARELLFSSAVTTVIKLILAVIIGFAVISFVFFIIRAISASKRKKEQQTYISRRKDAKKSDDNSQT